MTDAIVVGAGPNGLVAANWLADRGWTVLVVEAEPGPGGAVRSTSTSPGFTTGLFSAFYPFPVASPSMRALGLQDYGLSWSQAPAVLAQPRPRVPDQGVAVGYDLGQVYLENLAICRRQAQSVVRDRQLAEDVVQDVFIKLWQTRGGTYRPDQGPVGAWLQTVVHHRSVDEVRKAQDRCLRATGAAALTA